MNWLDLANTSTALQRAGFDVSSLTVQWHKKLAYPLIAPISMMLAIPFAILVGSRGAIGGIAIGVGIGIAYWAVSALLEAMGGIGQLPPMLAAWSPDLIFLFPRPLLLLQDAHLTKFSILARLPKKSGTSKVLSSYRISTCFFPARSYPSHPFTKSLPVSASPNGQGETHVQSGEAF